MGHPTSQNLATGKARQPWLKAVRYASSSATSEFELPPVLYIQGTSDVAHPRADRDRFLESYPKAGGRVDLDLYEGEGSAGRVQMIMTGDGLQHDRAVFDRPSQRSAMIKAEGVGDNTRAADEPLRRLKSHDPA